MPKETVSVTELETAILRVFIEKKILNNKIILRTLKLLVEKLEK